MRSSNTSRKSPTRPPCFDDSDGIGCFGVPSSRNATEKAPNGTTAPRNNNRRYRLFQPVPLRNKSGSGTTKISLANLMTTPAKRMPSFQPKPKHLSLARAEMMTKPRQSSTTSLLRQCNSKDDLNNAHSLLERKNPNLQRSVDTSISKKSSYKSQTGIQSFFGRKVPETHDNIKGPNNTRSLLTGKSDSNDSSPPVLERSETTLLSQAISRRTSLDVNSIPRPHTPLETTHQDDDIAKPNSPSMNPSASDVKESLLNQSNFVIGHNQASREPQEEQLTLKNVTDKKRRKRNKQRCAYRNLFHKPPLPTSYKLPNGSILTPKKSSSCGSNVLNNLYSRSIYDSSHTRTRDGGCYGLRPFANQKWKIHNSVQLDMHPRHVQFARSYNQVGNVNAMDFDSEGILLAVADSQGVIRIFDFDEVNAIDTSVRRQQCRDAEKDEESSRIRNDGIIAPFIAFQGRKLNVGCIKWNPHNQDQLVVALTNDAEVRVYDVSSSSEKGPLFMTLSSNKLNISESKGYGNKSLHFLPHEARSRTTRVLIGGIDGSLRLWKIPLKCLGEDTSKSKAILIWTISVWNTQHEGISNITTFLPGGKKENSGLVMLAGDAGSFALLDISKCTRKAFSCSPTPQLLKRWNILSHREFRSFSFQSKKCMGVMKCSIWADQNYQTENVINKHLDLTIILNCGWIVEMKLDVRFSGRWEIFSPRLNLLYTGDVHEETRVGLSGISTSTGILDDSSSLICVVTTAATQAELPNKDKRVLEADISSRERPLSLRDKLVFYNRKDRCLMKEMICVGLPKAIVCHESWIIVSSESMAKKPLMELMVLRD
jgi:hypothetical protein